MRAFWKQEPFQHLPVFKNVIHVSFIVDCNKQSLGTPINQPKLLARQAHSWRIHQRQHFLHVLFHQTIKELFVAILHKLIVPEALFIYIKSSSLREVPLGICIYLDHRPVFRGIVCNVRFVLLGFLLEVGKDHGFPRLGAPPK